MAKLLFSFIFLVFFSLGAQSQNNKNQASRDKIITYNLSQVKGQQQLNELKADLMKLKYVTKVVTSDFSEEETISIKIYVSEVLKDEDDGFDQAGLKKFFAAKGIKPSSLKIQELN